ncbi:MAG: class 1 fructose-bisphosphatase [Deltaproteobacteria bacterium]|nr:class 1 fructose-bisphosphatase [Deltaproteobacteria bacterium]
MSNLGITVTEHIMLQQKYTPKATGAFTRLLRELVLSGKLISREVNKAGLVDILGFTGETNVQGEEVQKLDDYANDTLVKRMSRTGQLCVMASEEVDGPIQVSDKYPRGAYVMIFDPLDGSSNIDANVSIGTIFSIHRRVTTGDHGTMDDILQPGAKQVAAGYVLYSSSTMLVYTTGQGVHGFTLDPTVGEFLLSHENIRIPEKGGIYSVNEGNYHYWDDRVKSYVDYLKTPDKNTKRPYSSRYIGSLVADFHRNLLYGGIFMNPADLKSGKPKGKLRLMCECAPLAFVCEQAGGYASDGKRNILDIEPTALHQRVPLYIGSRSDVLMAEKFLEG